MDCYFHQVSFVILIKFLLFRIIVDYGKMTLWFLCTYVKLQKLCYYKGKVKSLGGTHLGIGVKNNIQFNMLVKIVLREITRNTNIILTYCPFLILS